MSENTVRSGPIVRAVMKSINESPRNDDSNIPWRWNYVEIAGRQFTGAMEVALVDMTPDRRDYTTMMMAMGKPASVRNHRTEELASRPVNDYRIR